MKRPNRNVCKVNWELSTQALFYYSNIASTKTQRAHQGKYCLDEISKSREREVEKKRQNHLFIGNGDWYIEIDLTWWMNGVECVWSVDELNIMSECRMSKVIREWKCETELKFFGLGRKKNKINTDERTIAAMTAAAATFNLLYFLGIFYINIKHVVRRILSTDSFEVSDDDNDDDGDEMRHPCVHFTL